MGQQSSLCRLWGYVQFPLCITEKAYVRFMKKQPEDFASFCEKEAEWLEDYALFMALKDAHGGIAWFEWEKELKTREQKALSEAKETYADDILFYKMLSICSLNSGGR